MRQLASYALEARQSEQPTSFSSKDVHRIIRDWIASKGKLASDGAQITLKDGEVATIETTNGNSTDAKLTETILTQPKGDGWFKTSISVAESASSVAVSVALSAASSTLAPLILDIRCPRVIHDLLALEAKWRLGESLLQGVPKIVSTAADVDELIGLIWRTDRSIPIIVVSDYKGEVFHPKIVEELATDLAGLALVVRLKAEASWALTEKKGKAWSCYMGAVRTYWPRIHPDSNQFDHPVWTLQRLLGSASDAATASTRIRSQLRRRILGQSAFAVSEPTAISKARRDIRALTLAALNSKASEGDTYKTRSESYAKDIEKLTAELELKDDEIVGLKSQVSNLQLALQWRETSPDAIEPADDTPPSSVEDAVLTAMDRYGNNLVFGEAVNEGIRGVDKDAGPPDKILSYLKTLSELTDELRKGGLGKTIIKWLLDRGVNASGESETGSHSKSFRAKRTWNDGSGKKRYFELHLKPAEGTAPSRCVRIYFEYDAETRKTIIGWVGRHPQ
jgi:hypothetical protein